MTLSQKKQRVRDNAVPCCNCPLEYGTSELRETHHREHTGHIRLNLPSLLPWVGKQPLGKFFVGRLGDCLLLLLTLLRTDGRSGVPGTESGLGVTEYVSGDVCIGKEGIWVFIPYFWGVVFAWWIKKNPYELIHTNY